MWKWIPESREVVFKQGEWSGDERILLEDGERVEEVTNWTWSERQKLSGGFLPKKNVDKPAFIIQLIVTQHIYLLFFGVALSFMRKWHHICKQYTKWLLTSVKYKVFLTIISLVEGIVLRNMPKDLYASDIIWWRWDVNDKSEDNSILTSLNVGVAVIGVLLRV